MYIVAFILLFSGLIYLSNASYFKVNDVSINDLKFSNKSDIEKLVKENISGRHLGIFSRSNIFLIPRLKIERDIKNNHASISAIDISISGLNKIELEIEEFVPSAKWCDIDVDSAPNPNHVNSGDISSIPKVLNDYYSDCYLMTSDGVIFSKDFNLDGDFIKTFGYINSDPIRQNFSNPKTFRDLIDFVKLLRRLNIEANEIWTTNGEVYAIVTKDKVKLYIDSEDDIVSVFNNLQTVIERDAINQAQFNNIDYIDLRFGNRVFYKLK